MVVVVGVGVVRGGEEVAERLAGELAPAEQEVEVHHEALAAEAPAQHVVDGAEHRHEALPEPGLHATAAAAGRSGGLDDRPAAAVGLHRHDLVVSVWGRCVVDRSLRSDGWIESVS